MKYSRTVLLKDGRACILRNGTEEDAQAVLDNFVLTHGQTDHLLTYPDEISFTAAQEGAYLKEKTDSAREIELVAEVGGVITGTAGIDSVGKAEKTRHRASFGISIDRAWWGLGIGLALTEACIECAETAGYAQLELEVAADNFRAFSLYRKKGFVEYGRNPAGFRSRSGEYREMVLMLLRLDR